MKIGGSWFEVYTLIKKYCEDNIEMLGLQDLDKNELRNKLRVFLTDLRRKNKCNQLSEIEKELLNDISTILKTYDSDKNNNKNTGIKK